MPKISQFESGETLSNQPTSRGRNIGQAGITGENISRLGGAIEQQAFEYSQRFKAADILRQKTEASLAYQEGYSKLSEEILNDNESDFETLEKKAREGLDRLRSQAGGLVRDRSAKVEFDSQIQLQNAKATAQIRTELQKKMIERGVTALDRSLTNFENNFNASGDPAQMQSAIMLLNEYKDKGFISSGEHLKKVKELNKSALFSQFSKNPQEAISQLDSASGFAEALDPQERAKMKGELLKLKEKNDKENENFMKQVEDDTEREVSVRLTRGEITQNELDSLVTGGVDANGEPRRISRTFYQAASKAIFEPFDDPAINSQEKLNRYADLISDYTALKRSSDIQNTQFEKQFGGAKGNDLEQIQDFRKKVAESTRYLTRAEAQDFYEATQGNLNEALNPKVSAIDTILQYGQFFGIDRDPLVATVKRFFKNTSGKSLTPEQTMQEAKKAVDEDKSLRNPNKTRYEVGQVVRNARGQAAKITGFDDDGEPLIEVIKNV